MLPAGASLANQPSGGSGIHTPMPPPKPTPPPPPPKIPAPTGLQDTRDPQVCGTHATLFGTFACAAAYKGGSLVLVFNWTGDKAYPNVSGFDVYEVDEGKHKLVDQNTTQATVGFVTKPAGGFANRCYAVTAVVGAKQSKQSNWVCTSTASVGPFTTVLIANAAAVRSRLYYYSSAPSGVTPGAGFPCTNAQPCVGGLYNYATTRGTPVEVLYSTADYYRAYFHFKLTPNPAKNRYLISAMLADKTTNSFVKSSSDYCLDRFGPASSDWMSEPAGSTDMVGGKFVSVSSSQLSPPGIDVTSMVRSWLDGSTPNNGFVFRSKLEATSYAGGVFIYCVLQLDKGATLTIVHS